MSEGEEKTFTARVQSGYRIQIPEPLRQIMAIHEGDIVEVKIRKAQRKEEPKTGET